MAADGSQTPAGDAANATPAADGTVAANIVYMVPAGAKPVTDLARPGERPSVREGRFEERQVTIHDARPMASDFTLERNGFAITRHDTAVADFYDDDEVTRVYYPEVERLIQDASGARRVHVFDHTVRANDKTTQKARQVREPVRIAHNDYTDRSAPQRVRDLLPDEAAALTAGRFGIMQVWRPIGPPVWRTPLAICDAQSLADDDAHLTELRYVDRVGEVLQFAYNPDHRWYYVPGMTRDEAFVFKVWESERDGRARFTAHTGFDHPDPPADAPERESIEMRALVFW